MRGVSFFGTFFLHRQKESECGIKAGLSLALSVAEGFFSPFFLL